MFCVECGKPYEQGHNFCNNCGASLPKTTEETQSPKAPFPNLEVHSDCEDSSQPDITPFPSSPAHLQTGSASVSDSAPLSENVSQTPAVRIESNDTQVQQPEDEAESDLKGLGGWLILVGLGLCIGPFLWGFHIFRDARLFNNGTAQLLSDPTSSVYMSGYSGLLRFELVATMILLATNIYLLNLFFRKRKAFPRCYTGFLVGITIYAALDYILVSVALTSSRGLSKTMQGVMSAQSTHLFQSVIVVLIWGTYMQRSKRVKATFTG